MNNMEKNKLLNKNKGLLTLPQKSNYIINSNSKTNTNNLIVNNNNDKSPSSISSKSILPPLILDED